MTVSSGSAKGKVPRCIALILCDLCVEDKKTGNKTLVGLFNRILVAGEPAIHPRLTVVLSLVDGRGKVPVDVVIRDLTGDKQIFRLPGHAEFNDPLGELDVVMELRNVPLPNTGTYVVEVVAAGELLSSRRFSVGLVEGLGR